MGVSYTNHQLLEHKLDKKYNLINNGEKIKFLHLKMPNPVSQNVISFISQWPQDLNLTEYVDYDTMYDKSFVDPLRTILEVIDWKTEHVNTLESFFL